MDSMLDIYNPIIQVNSRVVYADSLFARYLDIVAFFVSNFANFHKYFIN